jgi:hypothetical protein
MHVSALNRHPEEVARQIKQDRRNFFVTFRSDEGKEDATRGMLLQLKARSRDAFLSEIARGASSCMPTHLEDDNTMPRSLQTD